MPRPNQHPYTPEKEHGITGLETAIILIAFVVVASVLSYTILSSGLFASEKSQEALYSGLTGVRQTVNIKGAVKAFRNSVDTDGDRVGDVESLVTVTFMLGNSLPGNGIDVTPAYTQHHTQNKLQENGNENSLVMELITDEITLSDCAWTMEFIGRNDGDNLLENNEIVLFTVWSVDYDYHPSIGNYYELGSNDEDPFIDNASELIEASDSIEIQIIPSDSAVITINRTLPPVLDSTMSLN